MGPDILILTDIYPAGEAPLPGVSGRLIYDAVKQAHPRADVRYMPTLAEVADALPGILCEGDLCLTLGAGDVTRLADMVRVLPGTGEGGPGGEVSDGR